MQFIHNQKNIRINRVEVKWVKKIDILRKKSMNPQ